MKKIIPTEPASYSSTITPEIEAIACLINILDLNQIVPDIKTNDKFPNIDGYVEFITADVKLEVQVKKLIKKKEKISYQSELSFLSYCERSVSPVLLIAVDIDLKRAYWMHIDRNFIEKLAPNIKGKTVSIEFDPKQIISSDKKDYIEQWRSIHEKYLEKLLNYERVEKELIEANFRNSELSKITSVALGEEDPNYREIHIYLDYLNGLLDKEFAIVKDVLYRNFWKIGLAIGTYEDKNVSYILYPIYYSTNDVQIKRITKENENLIQLNALNYIGHNNDNPIRHRPLQYAYERLQDNVNILLENDSLWFINNYLADEFIINFISHNYRQLGLDKEKENYTLEELEKAISLFYGLWLEETGIQVRDNEPALRIDISAFNLQMFDKDFDRISAKARTRFNKGEVPKLRFILYSREFNINYLRKVINFKKDRKLFAIERPFTLKEKINKNVYWKWESYSAENFLKNIEFFFKNLCETYNGFINSFFPILKDELSFYAGFDKLVINLRHGEKNEILIEYYYLKVTDNAKVENEIRIYFYPLTAESPISRDNWFEAAQNGILMDSVNYKSIRTSWTAPDFMYAENPMHTYLVQELKERFQSFFDKRIK